MRAMVSLLMSVLLFTTPLTPVLAQATEGERADAVARAPNVSLSVVADPAVRQRPVIGVPQLDPASPAAALLAPVAIQPLGAPSEEPPAAKPISTGGKVVIVAIVLIGLALLFVAACNNSASLRCPGF